MEDILRLRQMPPGTQLLSRLRLARRIRRRLPVAFHQRACARQYPEGRHLFGRSAHVGRGHQFRGIAGDCRRRRQVRDPDGEGHRRSAHRSARHREGGSARRLGRSRQGRFRVGPGLCQGAAHGEDLRRFRLVPLRHPGFDRPRHPHREVHVGVLDAGKAEDGGLRLSQKLRRSHLQGHRRDLRRQRFRDPFRRCRRARHQGHRGSRSGQDRG
ncbi:hypothetical protein D3C87_1495200 [compost metagenome]